MKVMIMGCGRVGARMAVSLQTAGHEVTVLDVEPRSFRRLPDSFTGRTIVGNGMDQARLEAAGIAQMDAFVAVTQGDNRNYFGSQLAKEVYGIRRVLCRIYDPNREELFRTLGLETFSPTRLGAQIMVDMLLSSEPESPEAV
ncbi:MAG TPA: TrkA family potassium uptake protein [Dehalococcoidia bacterium]|nr:TrkA family potassium uptake protein [Dehalococcoidia bacterium]